MWLSETHNACEAGTVQLVKSTGEGCLMIACLALPTSLSERQEEHFEEAGQFTSLPKTTATSACASASDRAAFAQPGASSGTTPRPIAVDRNGARDAAASARSAASACENAAPLPTTSSGLRSASALAHNG